MSQNNRKCKIIVDAMGGDFVPQNPTIGAVEALKETSSIEIFLIGDKTKIEKVISEEKFRF